VIFLDLAQIVGRRPAGEANARDADPRVGAAGPGPRLDGAAESPSGVVGPL